MIYKNTTTPIDQTGFDEYLTPLFYKLETSTRIIPFKINMIYDMMIPFLINWTENYHYMI